MIRFVYRKEMLDALRDRRSLFSALVFGPLFGPIIFAAALSTTLRVEQERAEQILSVPIVGQDNAPNLVAYLESRGVEVRPPVQNPEDLVKREVEDVVMIIPPSFEEQWKRGDPAEVTLVVDRSRRAAATAVGRVRGLLSGYGRQIGRLRLQLRGVDPNVTHAIVVAETDLSTPQSRGALILAMLPYLLMLAVFIGSMYLAIDSTAGERERGSLEPLLIIPVKRRDLMAGKLTATTTLGLVSLTLSVATFAIAIRFVPTGALGFALSLDLITSGLVFLIVAPIALVAGALQMIVSAFTKSFREAQTYVSLLLLVPMLPSIGLLLVPVKTKVWMMAVPVLSQNLLIEKLVRGDGVVNAHLSLSIASTLLLAAVLSGVCAKLYEREALLF